MDEPLLFTMSLHHSNQLQNSKFLLISSPSDQTKVKADPNNLTLTSDGRARQLPLANLPPKTSSLVIFKGMILLSFPKSNMGNLSSQDYGFRGSITLAKAEGKTFRLLFHVNFRGFTRVIVHSHQRTSTRRFWWQYSVLGSEYPLGDSRFWC